MEPKKYYFMTLKFSGGIEVCGVADVHPFIRLKECKTTTIDCILLNWKLISAEEYNLFEELFNSTTC